jgi:hypothetical protein
MDGRRCLAAIAEERLPCLGVGCRHTGCAPQQAEADTAHVEQHGFRSTSDAPSATAAEQRLSDRTTAIAPLICATGSLRRDECAEATASSLSGLLVTRPICANRSATRDADRRDGRCTVRSRTPRAGDHSSSGTGRRPPVDSRLRTMSMIFVPVSCREDALRRGAAPGSDGRSPAGRRFNGGADGRRIFILRAGATDVGRFWGSFSTARSFGITGNGCQKAGDAGRKQFGGWGAPLLAVALGFFGVLTPVLTGTSSATLARAQYAGSRRDHHLPPAR